MRDWSSFALLVSHDNDATQQKLDVRGADLKVGFDTDKALDVGGCFVKSTSRAWWRAKHIHRSLNSNQEVVPPKVVVRLAQGDGDVCGHGGECVRVIPPRQRTRRTHSAAFEKKRV